jgi:Flp pilus assembly protein TadG
LAIAGVLPTGTQEFSNSTTLNLTGALYFPKGTVQFDNSSNVQGTTCGQVIADKINIYNSPISTIVAAAPALFRSVAAQPSLSSRRGVFMTPAKTRSGKLSGRRSERGTAAIEFGLFIPFLFLLFAGTVELGFAMYESMQVNNAVEAGMLYAAKNGWNSAGIANAVVNASSVYAGGAPCLTATPAPSQFCGCPLATGIAVTTCTSTCANGIAVGSMFRSTRRSIT